MTKVTVELDWDTVDGIVKKELLETRNLLREDLAKRKDGTGLAIFEKDKKKDIALMKDHIEAFETILRYYGVKDE
jgi:hypothetical protein